MTSCKKLLASQVYVEFPGVGIREGKIQDMLPDILEQYRKPGGVNIYLKNTGELLDDTQIASLIPYFVHQARLQKDPNLHLRRSESGPPIEFENMSWKTIGNQGLGVYHDRIGWLVPPRRHVGDMRYRETLELILGWDEDQSVQHEETRHEGPKADSFPDFQVPDISQDISRHAGQDKVPITAVEESDVGFLSLLGISGRDVVQNILHGLERMHPSLRMMSGMAVGMLLYRSMGLRGLALLYYLVLVMQRVLNQGRLAVTDQRLDLVARAMRHGVPVNKDGLIDPDLLQALRTFPNACIDLENHQISPDVLQRPWNTGNNVILDSQPAIRHQVTVAQILDGDTFSDTHGNRYRLAGIDTPELNYQGIEQPGAVDAMKRLEQLIPPGSQVILEELPGQPMRFNRKPVYAYVNHDDKMICVNEQLLKDGLARICDFYPYHPKIMSFIRLQLTAIRDQVGLWKSMKPLPAPVLHAPPAFSEP